MNAANKRWCTCAQLKSLLEVLLCRLQSLHSPNFLLALTFLLQFLYCLTTCPDLCLGLFSTTDSSSPVANTATYPAGRAPDSFSPDLKSVLIAHVIATKTTAPVVTDASMQIPSEWRSRPALGNDDAKGHKEDGRTLAVHSLAVLPAFQNQGLGKIILKSYMQRMQTSGVADRIAVLASGGLVKSYESMGYIDNGNSEVTFGAGEWNSMVRLIVSLLS